MGKATALALLPCRWDSWVLLCYCCEEDNELREDMSLRNIFWHHKSTCQLLLTAAKRATILPWHGSRRVHRL